MLGEVIVIGDLKLRDGASGDAYDRLGERMYGIVSGLPGFLSVKSFKADDGEEITGACPGNEGDAFLIRSSSGSTQAKPSI